MLVALVAGPKPVFQRIVAVLVGASWYAAHRTGDAIEAVDPLLVSLDGVPGRKAGRVGEKAGVAQGHESGTQGGVKIVTLQVHEVKSAWQH